MVKPMKKQKATLLAGWAEIDITPDKPVLVTGQFHARVSEGVMDPITATVLALESTRDGAPPSRAVMVSCDLVAIPDGFRDAVRKRVSKAIPGFDPRLLFLNATHTHAAPEVRVESDALQMCGGNVPSRMGVELPPVMDPADYVAFAADRIAAAVEKAWKKRSVSSFGFGLGQAVVGRNRRIAYYDGATKMYGLTDDQNFSHVEGYEDHSVNLAGFWNAKGKLTGLIVNVACPSQVSEQSYLLSADYWHDTRKELRRRFGRNIFILAQNSAAGDQSPHVMLQRRAEARMLYLKEFIPSLPDEPDGNLGSPEALRREIAERLADAAAKVLPLAKKDRNYNPQFAHAIATVHLSRRLLTEQDVKEALAEAAKLRKQYEALRKDIVAHPEKRNEKRWYKNITAAYRRMQWYEDVAKRFECQQSEPKLPVEIHVIRLGDTAFATNPFEYYLDFGMQIKARSRAVQTFLVQHVGSGTYLPTMRAITGKSYGAVPASTPVGPEGGRELVEETLQIINSMWET